MSTVYIGDTTTVKDLGLEVTSGPNGVQSRRKFRGLKDPIQAKEVEYLSLGWETTVTEQGALWELSATASWDARKGDDGGTAGGGTDAITYSWEIVPNMSEKNILQSNNATVGAILPGDMGWLKDLMDGKIDNTTEYIEAEFGNTQAFSIYKLIRAGVTSVAIFNAVIRRTMSVSLAYQIPSSMVGVGSVYSSAALIAAEAPPPIIAGMLSPSGTVTRGDGISVYAGWLKGAPTITVAAGSRAQIVQEWTWGEWSTVLYSLIT